jgi:hypothetical protein
MYFEQRFTLPPNTPASDPMILTLDVTPGIVKHVEIAFPPGCCGLAHLQVQYLEHVLYPVNANSDIAGDAETVAFDEDVVLDDVPYQFTLVGYNEDDTYPHTLIFRMQIISEQDDMTTILKQLTVGLGGSQA